MLNAPNLTVWLESLAHKWIQQGLKRFPVETEKKIGWGDTGDLIAGSNTTPGASSGGFSLTKVFDGQIGMHTIQFDGVDNTFDTTHGNPILTRAEILWAVNSATIRRVISVADGASISAPAQGVTVKVYDATLISTPIKYNVGVTITPGTRASGQQPPTLMPFGRVSGSPLDYCYAAPVAAGQTATWTVPANAGVISAFFTAFDETAALADTGLQIKYLEAGGGVVNELGGESRGRWIPIPGAIAQITMKNNTADAIRVSCLLGVDG